MVSASVTIFKKPILKFLFNFPLSLIPELILFSIVFPSISLATPILLEKKGRPSLESPKSLNRSLFSVKNCLFSGREISNLVRFTI